MAVVQKSDVHQTLERIRDGIALVDIRLVDARVRREARYIDLLDAEAHARAVIAGLDDLFAVVGGERIGQTPCVIKSGVSAQRADPAQGPQTTLVGLSAAVSRFGRTIERWARAVESGRCVDRDTCEAIVAGLTDLIALIRVQRSVVANRSSGPGRLQPRAQESGIRFCSWVPSRNGWKARYKVNGREHYVGLFRVDGDDPQARTRALAKAVAAVHAHRSSVLVELASSPRPRYRHREDGSISRDL